MVPGDTGSKTVRVVSTADAWGQIVLSSATLTGPDDASGDLWDTLLFTIEGSMDDATYSPLVTAQPMPTTGLTVYTEDIGGQYLDANQPYYIRITYNLPTTTGNEAQGDSMSVNVDLTAEQYANNPGGMH